MGFRVRQSAKELVRHYTSVSKAAFLMSSELLYRNLHPHVSGKYHKVSQLDLSQTGILTLPGCGGNVEQLCHTLPPNKQVTPGPGSPFGPPRSHEVLSLAGLRLLSLLPFNHSRKNPPYVSPTPAPPLNCLLDPTPICSPHSLIDVLQQGFIY